MTQWSAAALLSTRQRSRITLSDSQVKAIVALRGHMNQREIGELFGISYQHVSVVQNRRLKRQRI